FQAEDGIRDFHVTGVQTCALPISLFRGWRRHPFRPATVEATPPRAVARPPAIVKMGSPRASAVSTVAPKRTRQIQRRSASSKCKIGRASCRERVENAGDGGARNDK